MPLCQSHDMFVTNLDVVTNSPNLEFHLINPRALAIDYLFSMTATCECEKQTVLVFECLGLGSGHMPALVGTG
jgi:hypothetical protein